MAIDLMKADEQGKWEVGAGYLVGLLCQDAGVCLHDLGHGNRVQIAASTWEVKEGLRVTDEDGLVWRLTMVPVQLGADANDPPITTFANVVGALSGNVLFSDLVTDDEEDMACQEMLTAVHHLDLAKRALHKAAIHHRQAREQEQKS